jgi:hypothetical protein
MNMNLNMDRPPMNSTSIVRETQMRQSYVFSNANPSQQRSFISTSLVNDSYAYGDDLRKYPISNPDPESKISPITKKPTSVTTSNSLSSSKPFKSNVSLMKSKFFVYEQNKTNVNYSIAKITKYKSES